MLIGIFIATGPPGPPPSDAIIIGDGSALTAEEIETLGKLTAVITAVTVTSPPVVDFTVTDANGGPFGGVMPGFAETLSEDEARAIIVYFQSFWPDDIYARWHEIDSR